jgi:saccharopine dehydrogenase-like NADP-dependent oxidoreductase
MSNFRRFAIVGAGKVGNFIVDELLKQKAAGAIDDITIISRPVCPILVAALPSSPRER